MTLHELSQLFYLNRELEQDQERLSRLKAEAYGVSAVNMDGMPHGTDVGRTTESKAAAVVALEQLIEAKLTRIQWERLRLMEWIDNIDDSLTRQIYILRFVDGLPWEQVAASVGGNTASSVKMICYRYLRKHK